LDNATVKCWGAGGSGQLGQDSTANLGDQSGEMAALPAVNLGAGRTATAVTAGNNHTCALLDNATVKCWGFNSSGQLGQDSTANLGDGAGEMAALPAVNLGFGSGPASMTVALAADETTVVAGGTIHYHLTVTNTGLPALSGFTVSDPNAPGCVQAIAGLASGAHQTIDCTYTTTNADVGTYANTATVDTAETAPKVSNTVNVSVTPAPAPALSVNMSADESSVVVGGTVHLHVKVRNTGNVALTNVAITDANAPDCVVAPFSVAVGADHSVDCTHVATAGEVAGGYHNSASVVSTQVTTPVVSNTVNVAVTPAPAPALTVQTSADESSVTVGDTVHLHVKVTNTGNVALTNVAITDANATGCEAAPFSLAVGADTTIDCTHVATVDDQPTYQNRASVVATQITTPVVSNTVDVTVTNPSLSVSATADESSVVEGATIHLHVKVTNTGDVALTNVTITDANATGCEAAPFGLAVGDELTVDCEHVAVAVDVPTYTNTASVTSTEVTTPVESDEVQVAVTAAEPGLSVVASADEVSVAPGQSINQHLVVSNTGNVALHAVTISDPAAPDCADDGVFDLAVDGFTTIDCAYTTTGNDAGTYTNEASVIADEVATPVVSNPVEVTVDDAVTVVLSADQSSVVAGQAIGYHVTVKNTSALTLVGLQVADAAAPSCTGGLGFGILPAGAQIVRDCTHVPGAADFGTFSNLATVDSAAIVAVESNQVDVTVVAVAPALTVTEAADPTEVVAGEPIDLALTVTNTGNVALHRITVADPSVPGCQVKVFDLPVGAQRMVFCTHVSTGADVPIYQNMASVGADELTAAVDSNIVSVAVSIPAGESHVAGSVTEAGSGVPIGGAVAVLLAPTDYSPVGVAAVGASGHYSMLAAPGEYFLYVLDPADDHAAGFSGAPSLVTAAADTSADVDVELASTRGALVGHVHDDATAQPLAGVLAISVDLDLDHGRPGAGAVTAADGGYRISGLRPGPKLLELVDLAGGHDVEFYDDAPTPAGSSVLSVAGAAQTTADAELAAHAAPVGVAHLTGQVSATTGEPLAGVAVMAVHSADFSLAAGVWTDAGGHYDLDLDAGDYEVAFYDPTGDHGFEWYDDQGPGDLARAVTVTAGDPAAVDAALSPTTGVATGTVTEAGTATPLGNVGVFAIDAAGTVVGVATTAGDGTYALTGLPVGNLRVRFVDLAGTYATEYYNGSSDYGGAALIAVAAGATTPDVDAELSIAG
jgi:uncharacterized repeat protein (TIGR01451 family)